MGSAETGIRAPNIAPVKSDRGERIVRISSFSVAGVLGLLIVTSVMPPLVADQSDRAVVNAPITLLTAQISGEVRDLEISPGQRLDADQTVGRVVNERVDRANQIDLESKVSEARESVEATQLKKDSGLRYVSALDAEISRQTAQFERHFVEQIAEITARIGAADALAKQKSGLRDRQAALAKRDILSLEMVSLAELELSAAGNEKDAEVAVLNQKQAQLEALRRGVFVGDDLGGLAILSQKRREVSFDTERLAIEEREFAASAEASERLLATERRRLDTLSESKIATPHPGRVMAPGVSEGRHVLPGDTIATLVDCDRSFIAAIFSYRSAQDLAVGSRMRIESRDWSEPHYGRVREILPRMTDKADEQFAVSFPQTERRELYVLVEPERSTGQNTHANHELCGIIGRWVTVSRDGGLVPSASVIWRNAGQFVASIASTAFAAASAAGTDATGKIQQAFAAVEAQTR